MPLTSATKSAAKLTLTVVGDHPVPQRRLWDAFADPRQLERFWGPPTMPATFTRHDIGGVLDHRHGVVRGDTTATGARGARRAATDGSRHVALWPPAREFVRGGTSATTVGPPQPESGLLTSE
jgi:hypothetical protein